MRFEIMRAVYSIGMLLAAALPAVEPQPRVVPDAEPQYVFGGGARSVPVVWNYRGSHSIRSAVHVRLSQLSSATVAPWDGFLWKQFQALPGQTVLETAALDFPSVKAPALFLVQWFDDSQRVLGNTQVWVYPTNLLRDLGTLAGKHPLAVLDPGARLKPLLAALGIGFLDLENPGLENFDGRLAIIGPFETRARMPEGIARRVKALAEKGAGVVWIQPPKTGTEPSPSFYPVPVGNGAVVVAQSGLTASLDADPRSQINLVALARLALDPQPFSLPNEPSHP